MHPGEQQDIFVRPEYPINLNSSSNCISVCPTLSFYSVNSTVDTAEGSSSPKKKHKHKHKKHKRKREVTESEGLVEVESPKKKKRKKKEKEKDEGRSLKLKIKLGGRTFATKQ
jgi:hypothetical protein